MYTHRFSPHKFTLPQLFACMVLKTFLKTDYRGLVEWLSDCPDLCRQIELTKVPHFTTIQKAGKYLLALPNAHKLLEQTIRMTLQQTHVAHAAIDSTGLDTRYTSHYFVWRRNVKGLNSYQSMLYAKYPKLTVLCDCSNHLILAVKTTRGPSPDAAMLIPSMQAIPPGITIETLLADAGYDSERNHVYARKYRKVRSIIPARGGRRSNNLPRTKYRRLMKQQFNRSLYSKRSQVETVMSMIKRRWGCAVRAHGTLAQTRELWLMALTHNLAIFWLLLELFYRAGLIQERLAYACF